MCEPTTIALIGTAAAGGLQAYGQYQQGKSQNSYYQYLAGQSKLDAQASYDRAMKQSELIGDTATIQNKNLALKTAELSATQKAQLAASGVDLSSVSAQDLTMDTMTKAKMDEMMIRRNANLNSWETEEKGRLDLWQGEQRAKQYSYAGKDAKHAAKINAAATLLGTAASVGLGAADMGLLSKTKTLRSAGGFPYSPLK